MTQPFVPSIAEPKDDQFGTPLQEFKGVVAKYTARVQHFEARNGQAARDAQIVDFDISDVVVIRSREPYMLPIGKVSIGYSERGDTRWLVFTGSIRAIVPPEIWQASADPLGLLVGKQQHWNFGPGKLRGPVKDSDGNDVWENGRQKWGPVESDCWQVVSIEGLGTGGVQLLDLIADWAVGKTGDQVNQEVFASDAWKGYAGYQAAVEGTLNRSLLPALVGAGKLVLGADGVYQKGAS